MQESATSSGTSMSCKHSAPTATTHGLWKCAEGSTARNANSKIAESLGRRRLLISSSRAEHLRFSMAASALTILSLAKAEPNRREKGNAYHISVPTSTKLLHQDSGYRPA